MARQKGHIKYQGTIGDIRHFKIKGMSGYFAGLKGGPTANQIKTAPEFARTRENMSEFGGSAKVAKVLRTGLGRGAAQFTDSTFTGRLTAFMKQINLKDTTGVRGKRAIKLSEHKEALKGIVFKKGTSFDSICKVSVDAEFTAGSVEIIDLLQVGSMLPPVAPPSATHYRLVYSLVAVSDYSYDEESKTYEPINTTTNGNSTVIYSDYYEVNQVVNIHETAESGETEPMQDSTTVLAIGIEFFVKNNDNYLPIAGGAMKVAGVF